MEGYVCITGAAGGLGKAFAVECASRGWKLFLTDLNETALTDLGKSLSNTYETEILIYSCDLSEPDSRSSMFSWLKSREILFHSLINVAGVDYEGPFYKRTSGQIRNIIRVNIEAVLDITHNIMDMRLKDGIFRIINVSSLASFYPMPVKAVYAASKRFLLDFSLALREEVRLSGISVTALCPGGLPTTKEAVKGIDVQGFIGLITTKNTGYVASKTVDHALKGHSIYIPGVINKILKFTGDLVPPEIVARLLCNRWSRTYSKNHPGN